MIWLILVPTLVALAGATACAVWLWIDARRP